MALMTKTILLMTIAILAITAYAHSSCNVTVKREPKGTVEVIELTLPRHARSDDSRRHGSEEETRYEIFIRQNKNRKGSPRIKVFVESDEYPKFGGGTPADADHQPLALSIKDTDLNTDRQSGKSKSQTSSVKSQGNSTRVSHDAGRKIAEETSRQQRVKDVATQTTQTSIYHQSKPKPEETTVKPETYHYEPEVIKAQIQQPLQYGNQRTHHHHHGPVFENLPTPYHKDDTIPDVGKELVYEPDSGISVTHADSSNAKRQISSGRGYTDRDRIRPEYEEQRPSSNRRQSGSELRPVDLSNGPNPQYSGSRSSGNGYTRGGTQYSSGDSDGRYPYNNDETEYAGVVTNTERVYQSMPHNRYETTPATSNTYAGFPDSLGEPGHHTSRQTSSEGSNPLPSNVCPTAFEYTKHDIDRWFADIFVRTDVPLTGIRLDVILSKRADLLTAEGVEKVRTTDNLSFTILSLGKRLEPGITEVVKIMVKYNADGGRSPPLLQTINLNGRTMCSVGGSAFPKTTKSPYVFPGDVKTEAYTRPSEPIAFVTTTPKPNRGYIRTTLPTDYVEPEYNQNRQTRRPPANRPSSLSSTDNRRPFPTVNNNNYDSNNRKPADDGNKNIPCGLPAVQPKPLVTNGQKTSRGQWPWHTALYKNDGPNLSYSCGGTLVTELHVITAAHCVTNEYSTTPMEAKILLVYFGKYHLFVWTDSVIASRNVARVSVHPMYNATDFRSDIAVLTIDRKVDFTDFIRPACLWDRRNTKIDDIVGVQGTVVGWGIDETKKLSEELKQAKMPVIKHNVCLWSDPDFYPRFTSNTTYCAGFQNGTSVCNGDSGGGMVFPITVQGQKRWFLRGLVSISAGLKDAHMCDTHKYVVFTDVAKFLPWVEDLISQV